MILLGRRRARWVYSFLVSLTYGWIAFFVLTKYMPTTCLMALLTAPIGYKAVKITIKSYDQLRELIPALGANVIVVLVTQTLLGIGFLIDSIIRF